MVKMMFLLEFGILLWASVFYPCARGAPLESSCSAPGRASILSLENGEEAEVFSPLYPEPYPADSSCKYTVKCAEDDGAIIEVNCKELVLRNCSQDSFYISSGTSSTRYCDFRGESVIRNPEATLEFYSSSKLSSKGRFFCTIRCTKRVMKRMVATPTATPSTFSSSNAIFTFSSTSTPTITPTSSTNTLTDTQGR